MNKELNYDEAIAKLIKIADALEKKEKDEAVSPEMFEIITALTKVHGNDPADDNWTDIYDMMEDMMEHAKNNGRALVSADRPTQLRLGWECKNTGKTWSIRITAFKNTLHRKFSDKAMEIVSRSIMTQAGKQSLTDFINTNKK